MVSNFLSPQSKPTPERVTEDVTDQSKARTTLSNKEAERGLQETISLQRFWAQSSYPVLHSPFLIPLSGSQIFTLIFPFQICLIFKPSLLGTLPHWAQAGFTVLLSHRAKKLATRIPSHQVSLLDLFNFSSRLIPH